GFHIVLMRLYIESGLWAATFAMLAPFIALWGLSHETVWRISSAIIAVVMIGYGVTYPTRRRRIMAEQLPARRWVAIAIVSLLVIAALALTAAGWPYAPAAGPVALAASWTLACGAIVFILALNAFWEQREKP